ncbi:hypothetical protein IEQ34_010600 [Dendrobium chrysotoxum]|uniref:Uncharacterized protein n=1 Tax=Dendrobium chrysotoxum TaxID=161865 RepID=A0AAV7GV82_DENCH|nr:hypothetical protein IEQ34_010600 [Dendrobium chrysotoxum]
MACSIESQSRLIKRPRTQTCSIGCEKDVVTSTGLNSYSKSDVHARMACDQSAQELEHCTSNDEMEDFEANSKGNENILESDAAFDE